MTQELVSEIKDQIAKLTPIADALWVEHLQMKAEVEAFAKPSEAKTREWCEVHRRIEYLKTLLPPEVVIETPAKPEPLF